jgi:hypothetical protein
VAVDAHARRSDHIGKDTGDMGNSIVRAVVAAFMLMGLVAVGMAPQGVAAAEATASPSAELPNVVEITASGFDPDETVSTWLTGPSQQVQAGEQFDVGSDGDVTFEVRILRHFEAGRWAVTVHGLESEEEAIAFFDNPGRGPNLELEVSQPSGPAGTTFSFTGDDFREGESVSYWLTGPDGKSVEGGSLEVTNADGDIFFTYTVPEGSLPGAWTMNAYGSESDNLATVIFTVT